MQLYFDAEVALSPNEHPYALDLSARILQADPTREDAIRVRMRALAALGRRSEALRLFDQLRRLLAEDLRCSPDPATKSIREEIAAAV